MRTLIVADDLSGAADCAAAAGGEALVLLRPDAAMDAPIVAIDTDGRATDPKTAAGRVRSAVGILRREPATLVYQKLDSTLRGNWPSELAALREVLGRQGGAPPLAIVAPALPEQGRCTKGGRMFLDGVPLAAAPLWAAAGRQGDADIVAMLAGSGLTSVVLPAGEGSAGLAAGMRRAMAGRIDAVVCDAARIDDLDAVAQAGLALSQAGLLWAGSSGLMRALARAGGAPAAVGLPVPPFEGAIAVVVGSAAAIARRQVEALRAEAGLEIISIPPDGLRGEAAGAPALALQAGKDVVITIATEVGAPALPEALLVDGLADCLMPALGGIGALVVTGGATARAVLERAGARAIRLCGEVESGVPIGIAVGAGSMLVVTKAGAFGAPDTLVRALARLRLARQSGGSGEGEI